jgi:hypothetical protein
MAPTRPGQAAVPATPNRPARLNRSLLTLIGLILLLAGAYAALRGLGVLTPLLGQSPQDPLLPPGVSAPGWLPAAAIALGVIVALLCLGWLLAQTRARAHRPGTWRFTDAAEQGSTAMASTAAAHAVAAEIETYTGVHTARAVLTGDRAHPQLHLNLAITEHAPVTEIRARIDDEALPRLRQALELDALPTEILLRLSGPVSSRAQ